MSPRVVLTVLVTLAVAAASLWNLVSFRLENLADPAWPKATTLAWYGAFAVVLATAAMALWSRRWWSLVPALALVLAAGFLPRAADMLAVQEEEAVEQAEGADAEMQFQAVLLARMDDIEARREARNPWTAEEAYMFLEFVTAADLSWRDLPDHTPEAMALLRDALAAGVLDPNALTTAAPVADSPAVTLTLRWYDREIRPGSPDAIPRYAWAVLMALVQGGADIASDAAGDLRADLSKTAVESGRFVSLRWGEIPPPAEPVAPAGEPVEEGAADAGAE